MNIVSRNRKRAVQEQTVMQDRSTTSSNKTNRREDNNMMLLSNSGALYSNGVQGVYRRIRTPHEHDVLSGRGGGINAHLGNVQFREWVKVRKNDYNLAPSKIEKSRVAQEVIDLVRNQKPSGRFLQKDPTGGATGGWWIEIDEERVMAKTSQALREGAPQIRAAHHDEPQKTKSGRKSVRKTPIHTSTPATLAPSASLAIKTSPMAHSSRRTKRALVDSALLEEDAIRHWQSSDVELPHQTKALPQFPLQHNGVDVVKDDEPKFRPPAKRVRVEYNGHALRPAEETPPMNGATEHPVHGLPPPLDLALIEQDHAHSLTLPDIHTGEEWSHQEFINPFEDERFLDFNFPSSEHDALVRRESSESVDDVPKLGIYHRETSTSSDLGGLGALMNNTNEGVDQLNNIEDDEPLPEKMPSEDNLRGAVIG